MKIVGRRGRGIPSRQVTIGKPPAAIAMFCTKGSYNFRYARDVLNGAVLKGNSFVKVNCLLVNSKNITS